MAVHSTGQAAPGQGWDSSACCPSTPARANRPSSPAAKRAVGAGARGEHHSVGSALPYEMGRSSAAGGCEKRGTSSFQRATFRTQRPQPLSDGSRYVLAPLRARRPQAISHQGLATSGKRAELYKARKARCQGFYPSNCFSWSSRYDSGGRGNSAGNKFISQLDCE